MFSLPCSDHLGDKKMYIERDGMARTSRSAAAYEVSVFI